MTKKYIALTIGPIYKTISKAKKPKELFAGSYVFSYVMRKIIENFQDRDFITPYIKDEKIFEEKELGLFHDRFIFESQEGDLKELEKVIDEVLENLAKKLNVNFEYLKEYFQIHYLEKELDKEKLKEEKENIISILSKYLDTKELFFQTSQHSDEVLKALINRESFLLKDKKIVDDLKKISSKKYFAIVHADGDNMSKVIADADKIEDVSKALFDYCIESNKKIKDFGGQTIFAGGDDLLFFAPVYKNDKTIFDLCNEISEVFDKKIDNKVASLSFGVSIQYVKFPLYEALEESRSLLFYKAKESDKKEKRKNNIAFKVQKHSGQSFEAVIHKGDKDIYKKFLEFTSTLEEKAEAENFLHSIHHKINSYKNIINQIGDDENKLKNFFENYFNEDEHKKYAKFFENLVQYMELIYKNDKIKDDEKLNLVYATLRFVKFIKGKGDKK